MMRVTSIVVFCLLTLSLNGVAREIAGVKLEEQITRGKNVLQLNGAGIRTKFFFKIYIGALYLSKKSQNADDIINSDDTKLIIMHFLYSEVSKEKLVSAWNEGFTANLTKAELSSLKGKIDRFNAINQTMKAGDRISIYYQPETGSQFMINDKTIETIPGFDFFQALTKIWLGKKPVTTDLKNALLGK